eukprot:TRINITY_DN38560_c0_g1_i1.p1 TRINITY_DN38560_c0_g1~~TRINITY_DN38560_c0_g1_i1.p1  ORF type:complete len:129 (-),score=40.24 TRINITY_DN38560_c0_g1_i1:17-364(-)
MVDLLGRSGHLDEAEKLISNMKSIPDNAVWGSLLAACRMYGNIEMAKRAAERLGKMESQDAGKYVLLSNIYAAAGSWDAVAKVRRMMEESGVKKQPGCSWIEVKGHMHMFVMGDR